MVKKVNLLVFVVDIERWILYNIVNIYSKRLNRSYNMRSIFLKQNVAAIISSLIASVIFYITTPIVSMVLERIYPDDIVLFSRSDMFLIGIIGGLFILFINICKIFFPGWFMKNNIKIHKMLNYLTCILIVLIVIYCFNTYYYTAINTYIFGDISDANLSIRKNTIRIFLQHSVILIICVTILQLIRVCVLNKPYNHKGMHQTFAITSTCIPYTKKDNIITTYLVYNKSYNSNQWMFPGGHVIIENGDIPEKIAIRKAEVEAGLQCEIIEISSVNNIKRKGNDKFDVLQSAHLTYLFSLDEHVECYRTQGHKYHLDNIFIAEVQKKVSSACNYETLELSFDKNKFYDSNNQIDSKYIDDTIAIAIHDYIKVNNKTEIKYNQYGTYVTQMISDALMLIS